MDSYKSSDPELLLLLLLLSGLELSCPDLHATLTASFLIFSKGGGAQTSRQTSTAAVSCHRIHRKLIL